MLLLQLGQMRIGMVRCCLLDCMGSGVGGMVDRMDGGVGGVVDRMAGGVCGVVHRMEYRLEIAQRRVSLETGRRAMSAPWAAQDALGARRGRLLMVEEVAVELRRLSGCPLNPRP